MFFSFCFFQNAFFLVDGCRGDTEEVHVTVPATPQGARSGVRVLVYLWLWWLFVVGLVVVCWLVSVTTFPCVVAGGWGDGGGSGRGWQGGEEVVDIAK